MIIRDNKILKDVQQEFAEKFPYLRIEFYKTPHEAGQGSSDWQILDSSKTIGQVRKVHNSGDLSINGNLKVRSLEKAFREQYGPNVQVFRRSGDTWLQTITTDEWTLSEQNAKGEASLKIPG